MLLAPLLSLLLPMQHSQNGTEDTSSTGSDLKESPSIVQKNGKNEGISILYRKSNRFKHPQTHLKHPKRPFRPSNQKHLLLSKPPTHAASKHLVARHAAHLALTTSATPLPQVHPMPMSKKPKLSKAPQFSSTPQPVRLPTGRSSPPKRLALEKTTAGADVNSGGQ